MNAVCGSTIYEHVRVGSTVKTKRVLEIYLNQNEPGIGMQELINSSAVISNLAVSTIWRHPNKTLFQKVIDRYNNNSIKIGF
jgi:hypothetical protein